VPGARRRGELVVRQRLRDEARGDDGRVPRLIEPRLRFRDEPLARLQVVAGHDPALHQLTRPVALLEGALQVVFPQDEESLEAGLVISRRPELLRARARGLGLELRERRALGRCSRRGKHREQGGDDGGQGAAKHRFHRTRFP
jgi:hypothetical protein